MVTLDPAVQNIVLSDMIRAEGLLERDTFIETDISPHSLEQRFTVSDGLHPLVRINNMRKWESVIHKAVLH